MECTYPSLVLLNLTASGTAHDTTDIAGTSDVIGSEERVDDTDTRSHDESRGTDVDENKEEDEKTQSETSLTLTMLWLAPQVGVDLVEAVVADLARDSAVVWGNAKGVAAAEQVGWGEHHWRHPDGHQDTDGACAGVDTQWL